MLLNPYYNIDATPPAAGVGDITVTVPSGKVSSDLTDFPLMIDLRDMPSGFWDDVNATGGNIRAYAADGTTLIPHDVTYIDKTRQLGRMFVKKTLLAASDNEVVIKLGDMGDSALSVSDTNGRNAVWSDYKSVYCFPSMTDRTGATLTNNFSTSTFKDRSDWIEDFYFTFPSNPHQGLAVSGTTIVSIDTNYLRRYATSALTTLLASNSDPVGAVKTATGNSNLNHLSDGTIVAGELWIPVSEYPVISGYDEYLAVFNLSTLALDRVYNVSSVGRHHAGICYNPDTGLLYCVDYLNGASIMVYNTSGVHQGNITLSTTITSPQGIEWVDDHFIVSGEAPTNPYYRVELDGTVTTTPVYKRPQTDGNEGLSWDGTSLWIMNAQGSTARLKKLPAYADYMRLHNVGAFVTIDPLSTVFTMGASVYWADPAGDLQQAFLGAGGNTDSARSLALLYDEGPDLIGIWNNTDSWLYGNINPAGYDHFRVAMSNNGTTRRKVWNNGTGFTDNTVSARPTSTTTAANYCLGQSRVTNQEAGYALYQYFWVRFAEMSDAWMAADAANNNSPATFYSVAA